LLPPDFETLSPPPHAASARVAARTNEHRKRDICMHETSVPNSDVPVTRHA